MTKTASGVAFSTGSGSSAIDRDILRWLFCVWEADQVLMFGVCAEHPESKFGYEEGNLGNGVYGF
jgi:hypothetical protein